MFFFMYIYIYILLVNPELYRIWKRESSSIEDLIHYSKISGMKQIKLFNITLVQKTICALHKYE